MVARYISIDDQKKLLPGYTPEKAEAFHVESAKNADKAFMRALKEDPSDTVMLLCGGSAAGKTELCSLELADQEAIVFDSTLPTKLGAQNKLRLIAKAKKKAVVIGVLPDDLQRAFKAFLGRDRRFQPPHFYRTHSGSRQTLAWIATDCPTIEVRLFESSYGSDDHLHFRPLVFPSREKLVEFLSKIQYTEEEVAHLSHPL